MAQEQLANNLPSFDGCQPDFYAAYGGSDRKEGLTGPAGQRFLVKYASKQAPSYDLSTKHVNNVVSEYISSHILGILGYPVHSTMLGIKNGTLAVSCRNFVPEGGALIECGVILRKHYDPDELSKVPDISQLYDIFETDPMLAPRSGHFKACYWERFIGDALVGNFDRHAGNFGYIAVPLHGTTAAPIYDNGASLFPGLSEIDMQNVLSDKKELMRRARLFPKAALTAGHDVKLDYYDLMASGLYSSLTAAVVQTVPRIKNKMPDALNFIDGCTFLSDTRKAFYKKMLTVRIELLLVQAYEKCFTKQFDQASRYRVTKGIKYTQDGFDDDWRDLWKDSALVKNVLGA